MNRVKRWGWCGALALAFLFSRDVFAQPEECIDPGLLQELQRYSQVDPIKECSAVKDELCVMLQHRRPSENLGDAKEKSLCVLVYENMKRAAGEYLNEVRGHCAKVEREFAACKLKKPGPEAYECMKAASRTAASPEAAMSKKLKAEQGELLELELVERLKHLKDQYEKDKRVVTGFRTKPPAWGAPDEGDLEVICGKDRRNTRRDWNQYRLSLLQTGRTSIQGQLDAVRNQADRFLQLAFIAAKRHDDNVTGYKTRIRDMDDLIKRSKTEQAPPDSKKEAKGPSDITGTDQKPPQQQAGGGQPPGGGGGQQGGGAQSGQPSGFDQGGGSNAGTPPSFNAGNTTRGDSPKNVANQVGGGKTDSPASKTGEGLISPVATSGLAVGSGLDSGGLGTSRGLASTGNGRGYSSSSSSPGGGGGGLGGGGGGSSSCAGKDCQTMSATGGQFAPVGSLGGGGGMGGLGGDDTSALDNLFKTDDPKAGEGPGADALADLGGAEESIEGLGGEEQAASEGGEIGKADGGDLFLRVRTMYTRAQKKGLVAGMLKKL